MKQLNLTYIRRKEFIRTPKNRELMKACYSEGFSKGWVSAETYQRVLENKLLTTCQ